MTQDWRITQQRVVDHIVRDELDAAAGILGSLIPDDAVRPEFRYLKGLLAFKRDRFAEAVLALEEASQHLTDDASLWNNLGQAYRAHGSIDEACSAFQRAAGLNNGFADPLNNLGALKCSNGHLEEGIAAYQQAIWRQPEFAEARFNLALAYEEKQDWESASAEYDRAIEIRPDYVQAIGNLAALRVYQGRVTEAVELARRALTVAPGNAALLTTLGDAHRGQGDLEASRDILEEAVVSDPGLQAAHWNLALVQLSLGDYAKGWANYRYRHSVDRSSYGFPDEPWPSDLKGMGVRIEAEQGLGDQLYLARFADLTRARGADVSVRCDPELAKLIPDHGNPNVTEVRALGDLPYLLSATEVPPPLTLRADPSLVSSIKAQLVDTGPPPYIGVTYRAGIDAPGSLFKEIPLESLAGILSERPVTLVNLQRQPRDGETASLAEFSGRPTIDFSHLNEDLSGMLALLSLLDDYLGVSNTNMHLRAGLGLPARVLVCHPADYRWMATGTTSPWFPKFRLYRQEPTGDWSVALDQLKSDLGR